MVIEQIQNCSQGIQTRVGTQNIKKQTRKREIQDGKNKKAWWGQTQTPSDGLAENGP